MSATLVRYWRDSYSTDPTILFVYDWLNSETDAQFTVSNDDPIAKLMWRDVLQSRGLLTVYSTDQLEWLIDSMSESIYAPSFRVECTSRAARARGALVSDDYLIEMWLAAETGWQGSTGKL